MSPSRTTEDWIERIEPHLSTSLRAASDAITRTDAVQQWLHDASMEAAQGLADATGLQAEMQGYARMMDRLKDAFPQLLEAVETLTDGHAHVELHWRPTNPNFSRLYINVDHDYTVSLILRLEGMSEEAVSAVLDTIAEALPEGVPFPNRPNTATALVVHDGQGTGVRLSDRLSKDGEHTYRTVTLFPEEGTPIERLSPDDAADHLLDLLSSDPSDS